MSTEEAIELKNLTQQEKLDFISEGSYGCAFKREEPKKGKTKFIMKIQKQNDGSKREEDIGKLIRKIRKYSLYFAPILKSNIVTIGEVDDDEVKKCTIITSEENNKQKYVTNRIKYAGEFTIGDFIYGVFEKQPKQFLRTFFSSYFDMLYNIHLLNKNGIIHFDLKENNVIYNEDIERPILIDFGLSIDKKLLIPDNYSKYFFTYGYDYPPWCFEISIITFAVNEFESGYSGELLTEDQVNKLCNNFTDINPLFINAGDTGHIDIFTDIERLAYNKKLKEYLKPFIGGSWKIIVEQNLRFIDTWDVYAVHVIFLLLFYHIHLYEYINEEFKFIQRFVVKLKREIMATPLERKSYEDILDELMKDLGESNRMSVEYLVKSIQKITKEEDKLQDVKLKLDKLQLRELKKEKLMFSKDK